MMRADVQQGTLRRQMPTSRKNLPPPRLGSRFRVVGHSLELRLELLGLRDGQLGFRVRLGLGHVRGGR